jgi:Ran GTPase-activating protein (RanGAP) involved in mRNA processing and transport
VITTFKLKEQLQDTLKENTSLTSINLCDNNIQVQGAITIANILKYNTSLSSINLVQNDIQDKGAISGAIANALTYNPSLSRMSIDYDLLGLDDWMIDTFYNPEGLLNSLVRMVRRCWGVNSK